VLSQAVPFFALRAKFPILRRRRLPTGQYDEEYRVKNSAWISPRSLLPSELLPEAA
jgi:hypothetical protein